MKGGVVFVICPCLNESYLYWVALGLENMRLLGIFAYQDAPTHRNDDDGDDVDVDDDFYGHLHIRLCQPH